ncbi:hypothetical protein ACOME3_006829 [Neoechinorhynchus agilis]
MQTRSKTNKKQSSAIVEDEEQEKSTLNEVLMNYKIPRKHRSTNGNLYPIRRTEKEFVDLLVQVRKASNSTSKLTFAEDQITEAKGIENGELIARYWKHRNDLSEDQDKGAKPFVRTAFALIHKASSLETISKKGLACSDIDCSTFSHVLGKPEHGVHLFSSVEHVIEHHWAQKEPSDFIRILLCRIALRSGRRTQMQPLNESRLPMEPQPVYDHHVSDMSDISENVQPKGSWLVYVYGFDDDCYPLERPASIVPLAFFKYTCPSTTIVQSLAENLLQTVEPKPVSRKTKARQKQKTKNANVMPTLILPVPEVPAKPDKEINNAAIPDDVIESIRMRKRFQYLEQIIDKQRKAHIPVEIDRVDDPESSTDDFTRNRPLRCYSDIDNSYSTSEVSLNVIGRPPIAPSSPIRLPNPGSINLSQIRQQFPIPNLHRMQRQHLPVPATIVAAQQNQVLAALVNIAQQHSPILNSRRLPRGTFARAREANRRIMNGMALARSGMLTYTQFRRARH